MPKREYILEEFLMLVGDSVGPFSDGDSLYTFDDTPDEEPFLESYSGAEEIKVYMREIRVRLHEASGKPFITLNPKLGMELTFLKPEHKVYVHASHRGFESVKNDNERKKHTGIDDSFREALIKLVASREANHARAAIPLIGKMSKSLKLVSSEKNAGRIIMGIQADSIDDVRPFANDFKKILNQAQYIKTDADSIENEITFNDSNSAIKAFLIISRYCDPYIAKNDFFQEFISKIRDDTSKIDGKIVGPTKKGPVWAFTLEFKLK